MPRDLELPRGDDLAHLVSSVTESLLGFAMAVSDDPAPCATAGVSCRGARLRLAGTPSVELGFATDPAGGALLAAAIFGCEPDAADEEMIDDSLCELTNMTAGLIIRQLHLPHRMGIPEKVPGGEVLARAAAESWYIGILRGGALTMNVTLGTTRG